jgi:hypothetical protein
MYKYNYIPPKYQAMCCTQIFKYSVKIRLTIRIHIPVFEKLIQLPSLIYTASVQATDTTDLVMFPQRLSVRYGKQRNSKLKLEQIIRIHLISLVLQRGQKEEKKQCVSPAFLSPYPISLLNLNFLLASLFMPTLVHYN